MQLIIHELLNLKDAIDDGDYKFAINLCNKMLKKHDLDVVKVSTRPLSKPVIYILLYIQALKAVCLDRLGKSDEALGICDTLKQSLQLDEAVLQPLLMVYRSNRKCNLRVM